MRIFNWPIHSGKTTRLVEIMLQPGNEGVFYIGPYGDHAEYAWKLALEIASRKKFVAPARERFLGAREIARGQQKIPEGAKVVMDEPVSSFFHLLKVSVLAIAATDPVLQRDQIAFRTGRIGPGAEFEVYSDEDDK